MKGRMLRILSSIDHFAFFALFLLAYALYCLLTADYQVYRLQQADRVYVDDIGIPLVHCSSGCSAAARTQRPLHVYNCTAA